MIIYRGEGGGRFIFRIPRMVHPSFLLLTMDGRYLLRFDGKAENMRILIAEDERGLGGFVRKGLEAEHYAVGVSSDGEQDRALASELDYDLAVLDLNLPRLDGVAILKEVRSRKADLPILVLTGRGRIEDRVQCLDSGADDYLVIQRP